MPITLKDNQYNGINAHLHSLFQSGTLDYQWGSFHSRHISHLADALQERLPPGYRAFDEQSLQIRLDTDWEDTTTQRRKPDVTIYSSETALPHPTALAETAIKPFWEAALDEAWLAPEDEMKAIMVYHVGGRARVPVTRIELLSPANKQRGRHFRQYESKRWEALRGGLPLVEIDYLHESASPVPGLPRYPTDPNSLPYHITISDPRLPPPYKSVRSFGFRVDENIPPLMLPLAGDEVVEMDFDAPYQHTFRAGRWGEDVDYAQAPPRISSYREDDQQAIRDKMRAVQAAQGQG
jgi:hypothetical protein